MEFIDWFLFFIFFINFREAVQCLLGEDFVVETVTREIQQLLDKVCLIGKRGFLKPLFLNHDTITVIHSFRK